MNKTCKECRSFEQEKPERKLPQWCDRFDQPVPPGCYGCPSFERKRDKLKLAAAQIMNYWSQNDNWSESGIEDILRRHFPPVGLEAIKDILQGARHADKDHLDAWADLAFEEIKTTIEGRRQ